MKVLTTFSSITISRRFWFGTNTMKLYGNEKIIVIYD